MVGDPPVSGSLLFVARDAQGLSTSVKGALEGGAEGVVHGERAGCSFHQGGEGP